MASEALVPLGVLVIVIGIILIILGSLGNKADVKVAIGGFIGPVPFGFGNDKNMVFLAVALTVIFALIVLLSRRAF